VSLCVFRAPLQCHNNEFGTGLSYTTFDHSNLTIDKSVKTTWILLQLLTLKILENSRKKLYYFYLSDKGATPEVKKHRKDFKKISLTPKKLKQYL
jgi:beta-glucosidase